MPHSLMPIGKKVLESQMTSIHTFKLATLVITVDRQEATRMKSAGTIKKQWVKDSYMNRPFNQKEPTPTP